ncbi:MAG: PIN domain-containing protein [Spirochaetota bacterium]
MIHLDTHVVVWLYQGELDRFPGSVLAVLENETLAISPIVLLEMVYLGEIGRLRATAGDILTYLHEAIGLEQDPSPFAAVVARALGQTWTRDPFDRIIVAQAIAAGAELVTKDEAIRSHYPSARW